MNLNDDNDIPMASLAGATGHVHAATRQFCESVTADPFERRPRVPSEDDSGRHKQFHLHRNFKSERLSDSCPLPPYFVTGSSMPRFEFSFRRLEESSPVQTKGGIFTSLYRKCKFVNR